MPNGTSKFVSFFLLASHAPKSKRVQPVNPRKTHQIFISLRNNQWWRQLSPRQGVIVPRQGG